MIIYLIKLTLILIFNTCVSIYYINSECKCCCGNSKSGEISGGNKINLGTNPLKSIKPKPVGHIGEMRSGGKCNLSTNPLIGTNPTLGLNPKPVDHKGRMRSNGDCKTENIVNLTKITLNVDETIQYNELKKNPKVKNKETKCIVNNEFKDCIFYSINAELYDSITEESNIQFVNNLSNNSNKYILFAVKTTANNTYMGYCSNGTCMENNTGIFENSTINREFKMISCGKELYSLKCMFYDNTELKEVIFLEGFNTSKVIDMSNMFEGCKNLEELDLSKLNSKKVQKIFAMFRGCESLQELVLANFNNNCSIVKNNVGDIFYNCVKLHNIKTDNKLILEEFNIQKKKK